MDHNATSFYDSCYLRILQVIKNNDCGGKRDLVALVRHILRFEEELQNCNTQTLKVRSTELWPSRDMWTEAGVDAFINSEGWFTLRAKSWRPIWLPETEHFSAESDSYAGRMRRNFEEVDGDPFLKVMRLKQYRCTGQREALRAVLTAPSGSTLTINLPTGAGKSLCANLPAVLQKGSLGVTVVVVPTTALCIDQEQSVSTLIGYPTAFYGGSSGVNRDSNLEVIERIKVGTQAIVFTSPEALTQTLCGPVYIAAKRGYLRMLVIDEAHIVDQWGDMFRSSFQELAGLRNDLLRVCKGEQFKTLLLSATITESCLDTLEVLFGHPGPFEMISAVQLRPEPSFWFSYCGNKDIKEQRVLEAVHNLPRPLILYVSKKADATEWLNKIISLGYKRVEMFTGDTGDIERLNIIKRWRKKEIDLIVATSAFGLGVDQDDVRAVVHACVPESIDRYYQEIGRGGRDGRTCVSLLIYCDADLSTAKRIRRKTLIGLPRGLERWTSMFNNKKITSQGYFRVPLDVTPSQRTGDIDMRNDYNIAWNIRTLTLMSRAGLIEMDSEIPPWLGNNERPEGINETNSFETVVKSYKNSRVVRILNENHLDPATWQALVNPIRQRALALSLRDIRLMMEVLDGRRCVGEILTQVYTIEERRAPFLRRGAIVSLSCGGCPNCRGKGSALKVGQMPVPSPVWPPLTTLGPGLSRLFGGDGTLIVFYDNLVERREVTLIVERLIKWAIQQGARNLVLPIILRYRFKKLLEEITNEVVFLSDELQPLFMPQLPVILIHPEGYPVPVHYYNNLDDNLIPRVMLLPKDTIDPKRSYRTLDSTLNCKRYRLKEFCTEVGL